MPTLIWLNGNARKTSAHIPYRLHKADASFSCGTADTENMLIQGDSLEIWVSIFSLYNQGTSHEN